MSFAPKDTEEAWFESLRTEVRGELSQFDGAAFGSAVMSALDAKVEDADFALRADEASPEEIADAQFVAGNAEVQSMLRIETAQELADVDFIDFGAEVMARMEPLELSAAVQAALRNESAQEIAELESEWPDFVEEVMVRIDPVPQNVTVQAMLQQEVGAELKRRDGEWNAFTARVFDAIDSEQLATARLPLEEQAVHQLREEVDGELHQLAPKFEEEFGEEVERKIFKSAQTNQASEPGLWQRFTDFVRDLSTPQNYGWAAAMGAAAVLLVVTNIPSATDNVIDPPMEALQGYVSVQDMSFEGSAIVIPDEGMTIVLLSDES